MAINVTTQEVSLCLAPATAHARAAVTNAAASLGSFITAGIPVNPSGIYGKADQYPIAVYLQVESGSSGSVYVTLDGLTTPTTALGLLLPQGPSMLKVTGDDMFRNDRIKIVASIAGPTYVQCFFVF